MLTVKSNSDLMAKVLFNIAAINTCTEAEGPERRLAIWFQGCDLGCKGCCNPEFQPMEARNIMSLAELVSLIKRSSRDNCIEGVTYLGGEPTLQSNLPLLSKAICELGLGVILFTGNVVEKLPQAMLENVDLVVDGPYMAEYKDDNRNSIGSTNQRLVKITDRYSSMLNWFTESRAKRVEVSVLGNYMIFTGNVV